MAKNLKLSAEKKNGKKVKPELIRFQSVFNNFFNLSLADIVIAGSMKYAVHRTHK